MTAYKAAVITMSDKGSRGERVDTAGPLCEELLRDHDWDVVYHNIIPDDYDTICRELVKCADELQVTLVVTTGGTGPAPRDVLPEVTEKVCQRMMPGFGELMRQVSLKVVPTAILSRQTAGIRGTSLIVNLPGKPSAVADCLNAVMPAIPYCIDLIGGPRLETDPAVCTAFRPKP